MVYLQAAMADHSRIQIASVSSIYTVQSYISLRGAREVYAAPTTMITPLSARTFGTWTALSSVVRLYAAFNIHNRAVYELAMWTFAIAILHFGSEYVYFRTARLSRGLASPMVVASSSLVWMLAQHEWYVR